MSLEFAVGLFRQALLTVLIAAAPVLIVGMVVGLTVSILQAVSQVHEMTLTFIPKIVAIFATLMLFGSWVFRVIMNFTASVLANLSEYANM